SLIATAEATEWGKKFGYNSILTPETYRDRVPIHDYTSLKPYIDRMMRGEQNILLPSDITWFAKSSSTTADRSKFIPVSEEALEDCHCQGGKDMLSVYCHNRPDTKILTGKSVVLGGSSQINSFNSDS